MLQTPAPRVAPKLIDENANRSVVINFTGKRYRIRSGRQMNVEQLDECGHLVATLCFLPEKYVPVSDVMLAQKIALESDEPAALSVAIRH